jgi:hypothetical protein
MHQIAQIVKRQPRRIVALAGLESDHLEGPFAVDALKSEPRWRRALSPLGDGVEKSGEVFGHECGRQGIQRRQRAAIGSEQTPKPLRGL